MFRKRPVVIEAVQWRGTPSLEAIKALAKDSKRTVRRENHTLIIPTLEGDHTALPGDWIIKGIAGELYPCKPDIFAETYAPVESEEPGGGYAI